MNRHFVHARDHLHSAVDHVVSGLRSELAPVEERVRSRLGREPEPETLREHVVYRVRRVRDRLV